MINPAMILIIVLLTAFVCFLASNKVLNSDANDKTGRAVGYVYMVVLGVVELAMLFVF